jgi:hypothetical protein
MMNSNGIVKNVRKNTARNRNREDVRENIARRQNGRDAR